METVSEILAVVLKAWPILAAVGGALAFFWPVYQFFAVRKRDAANREFETFHRLVRELVEPDEKTKTLYVDRQAAIIFELRHFKRYHEFTKRMLSGLREAWKDKPNGSRLLQEIDLTISFIDNDR
jgi:hypothetical protein